MIQPVSKPAPGRNGQRGKPIGEIHPEALPIFVHEAVLEEILDYSELDTSRELGGFLVGGLYLDQREYVEVAHFLPAVDVRSRAASLTFTHETWATVNRQIELQFPDKRVVGWHHTHPNFGVFLSGYDLFIHENFFSQSWQIAMVVDPLREEFGFFQWLGSDVVDCGFFCVEPAE